MVVNVKEGLGRERRIVVRRVLGTERIIFWTAKRARKSDPLYKKRRSDQVLLPHKI